MSTTSVAQQKVLLGVEVPFNLKCRLRSTAQDTYCSCLQEPAGMLGLKPLTCTLSGSGASLSLLAFTALCC